MSLKGMVGSAAQVGASMLRVNVLRGRAPLFASWNITFRCNLHCSYCGTHEAEGEELSTEQVFRGLERLWTQGIRWVTFSGGEPLLRKDMLEIAAHARSLGFQVFLSTNGWLLPKRADILDHIGHVNISLDGNQEVHDSVRGKGAYDKALRAVDTCVDRGVSVSLLCVLSAHSLDGIEDVIATARERRALVMFQPATQWLDSSVRPNPIAPPVGPYRQTVERLITLKKAGAPIRNSIPGLQHLAKWPETTPIRCSAGDVSITIEADGSMLSCHQAQFGRVHERYTIESPLSALPTKLNCAQCWCGPLVELGLVYSLRPGAVWNAYKIM